MYILPCAKNSPGQPSASERIVFFCFFCRNIHTAVCRRCVPVFVVWFTFDTGSYAAVRLGLLREDGGLCPAGDEGWRPRLGTRGDAGTTTSTRAEAGFFS